MSTCAFINSRAFLKDDVEDIDSKINYLKKTIFSLKDLEVEDIYVLLGEYSSKISRELVKSDTVIILDEKYEEHSLFESELSGISKSCNHYEKVLYMSLDLKDISKSVIEKLLEFNEFTVANFENREVHLALILTEDLKKVTGSGKSLIEELKDINSNWSSVNLCRELEVEEELRCQIKVTIFKDDKFFGPGVSRLIKLVDEMGSVKYAANAMNISYSKAWKMIDKMESELGFLVVDRKPGGSGGGESVITNEGRQFLNNYELIVKKSKKYTMELFNDIFK
ncbi:ModE molybdate transport repressor domain-containing protein [Anaerosphaera aminiphila DSM 21120]|uniref:ModE molybdate transport repressor domain-containing protein n=1 Tax=Anaerosphaera aminiphila DSM 21120 TaxID=1120995 RepID=A0A1M5UFF3_9FIRM|nr:LysR family transcriptional regulator [Anaerosphaera aminiphila]SHH61628.1 ModE molybdate transport repressor domain-containing protein [Anaerosphaera aminiphila DSM 21120]